MIYRDFQNEKLSVLGYGTMRLPVIDGNDSQIDEAAAAALVDRAMAGGINYYDTAYAYHGGQSEIVLGRILSAYPRDSYYLATKFPGYDVGNLKNAAEIFEKQLAKCGVDYFDFYLFHNVCENNVDGYLDPQYGLLDYLLEQKKRGRIRHLGFSAHGNMDVIRRFTDAYGENMEFCQIQLNYLDWTFQDAAEKVRYLNEQHLPVWVMEPVRGGRLASLAPQDEEALRSLRPQDSVASWALRFAQSVPGVKVVLSGMSNSAQLEDNLRTFSKEDPLSEEETAMILRVAEEMQKRKMLPCTACHYCVSKCPKELDIPVLMKLYNEHCFSEGGFLAPMKLRAMGEEKQPSQCIGCRSCEAVCPQNIKISEAIADFRARLK